MKHTMNTLITKRNRFSTAVLFSSFLLFSNVFSFIFIIIMYLFMAPLFPAFRQSLTSAPTTLKGSSSLLEVT